MELKRKERPRRKLHQLEMDLMNALVHPEDGEHRRRYLKRFLYGEVQLSNDLALKKVQY